MGKNTEQILNLMGETGVVPVFYYADADLAIQVVDACYRGGIRAFEFTNRGDQAREVFLSLARHIKNYSDASLGIGTIMNRGDARRFLDAGADFIVSPILKQEIGDECKPSNKPWIPGCATLTEIVNAHEGGAAMVKVFPASVLGPAFIKSVRPLIPSVKLMPTGGVEPSEENLREWLDAGVHCVGMGSQMITKEIIERKDWKALEKKVSETIAIIKSIRNQKP
jgi:2-dehydro-3-deoxyphosphogluconate aldolase / (4S)-4-hydroxy-2-oxoglutarate aldolase